MDGVDPDRFPYARELRKRLFAADDVIRIGLGSDGDGEDSPIAENNYLRLRLSRMEEAVEYKTRDIKLPHGKTKSVSEPLITSHFVDISVEALPTARHRLVLLTGEGGAGKTTALRRLALSLVDKILSQGNDTTVPVIVRIRQLAGSEGPLVEQIMTEASTLANGKCPFSMEELEKGRVALLLDALDEVADVGREQVLLKIIEFHQKYPKCLVVVTSRDYRSILELSQIGRFVHYWVLPIGLKEANTLISRVEERKHVDRQVMRTTLRRLHEAHGMTLSPMLITVFLSSSDFSKHDLPPISRRYSRSSLSR